MIRDESIIYFRNLKTGLHRELKQLLEMLCKVFFLNSEDIYILELSYGEMSTEKRNKSPNFQMQNDNEFGIWNFVFRHIYANCGWFVTSQL